MKLVVGLGNKGEEYVNTRHNAGRIMLAHVDKKIDEKLKIKFFMPESFMNTSGKFVAPLVKSKKDLAELIVIYDDIDLPIGTMKISFNRSSGGHNGLESIIKSLKSQEFLRIRIGICPTTPSGKTKKPKGETRPNDRSGRPVGRDAVLNFLLGEFKKPELEALKKLSKKVAEAIETIYTESSQKAMSLYN